MRSTITRSRILEKTDVSDVSAIGCKSLNKILPVFLGTGTYLVLKFQGICLFLNSD